MASTTIALLVVLGTQVLFTASDLLARYYMGLNGFHLATFLSAWFVVYFVIRIVAMFGQLYVFSHLELGRTMALFGATSIILANGLGYLLLGELLSAGAYLGVVLTVIAFLALAFSI
ncbi:MAG: hypothetical protein COV07_02335 [Candidatus Vogelbacteria bacterium CG10_big_fil_rev_8_21_14_0_10_45_14]|uniref:Uncharacterized protein n=1 Tax=Candidatus Vogelbacteria bacterium CG10_big_fil_rev_8_21_14_0_10_45_14 TaxID=1975042 RepID=A0A2H0RK45_9BACT|nr:MAG: hypothetical protein COV07_02335 [Candidatus Vogelbacteria bacterium CG10_big_fil_rev_8_21_14_0_10_45_14]